MKPRRTALDVRVNNASSLAACGESARRRERKVFLQIDAQDRKDSNFISRIWHRNANGKKPLSARYASCYRLLAFVLAGLVTGCSYATYPPRIVQGKAFPIEEARAVEEGDSATDVREVLGAPLEIKAQGDDEVWRYYARERKDGVAYILGFIPNRTPHFIWDYELELTIGSGGTVKAATYTETQIK